MCDIMNQQIAHVLVDLTDFNDKLPSILLGVLARVVIACMCSHKQAQNVARPS